MDYKAARIVRLANVFLERGSGQVYDLTAGIDRSRRFEGEGDEVYIFMIPDLNRCGSKKGGLDESSDIWEKDTSWCGVRGLLFTYSIRPCDHINGTSLAVAHYCIVPNTYTIASNSSILIHKQH